MQRVFPFAGGTEMLWKQITEVGNILDWESFVCLDMQLSCCSVLLRLLKEFAELCVLRPWVKTMGLWGGKPHARRFQHEHVKTYHFVKPSAKITYRLKHSFTGKKASSTWGWTKLRLKTVDEWRNYQYTSNCLFQKTPLEPKNFTAVILQLLHSCEVPSTPTSLQAMRLAFTVAGSL